jgi:outer membrane usher protein
MIKAFLLVLLYLLASFSLAAFAKEFTGSTYVAGIPFYDDQINLGDVEVEIDGEMVNWVDRDSLIKVLKSYLQEDTLKSMQGLPQRLKPSMLPFPFRFDPEGLKIETKIELEKRSQTNTELGVDLEEEKRIALKPAPLGGAVNYRLEQNWGDERLGGKFFSGQFGSFVNINSFVLENQTFYQSNLESNWYRGDTRIVKDIPGHDIRTQVGDVYPQIQGFMTARPLGGVNIQRNFSLNPYRLPYPTGHQTFTLRARSFVKYYVNSVMVKSEYLQPGNYNAKDIPLNNGLNTVMIEAVDDLGQKQVFVFKSSSNINLLNEGESRFDLSYGVPFVDTSLKRDYREGDGKIFSGFFQYGFTSTFSSSAYLQNQENFNLYGSEFIKAIPIGNLTFGHARSNYDTLSGGASSLGYQLITQGKKWFDTHTLAFRYENRDKEFKATRLDGASTSQNIYAANYTIPVSNVMTFSVGGNYGDVRDNNLENRYGYDLNVSFRVLDHHNLAVYVSRNRDEFKQWNETAYVFLTLSIPESNNYVSALYDQKQKNTRVNVLRDNQNKLYTVRSQAIAEYSEERQNGELDLTYPTPVGDFGGRITGNRTDSQNLGRGSARLNSAFVFAFQDDEFGMGISRPIPGSFVIFKPEERLKDQKIGLKSTSPYTESETGLFNEIVFSNLIAYQYRDIQLDPTFLDIGRSLVKEKFMLYPTYRSAHLIKLQERGSVILTGRLVNLDNTPIPLQVGQIGGVPFFTNRNGEIFVEGIEAGKHELVIEGREDTYLIDVSKTDRGMKDLGIIQIKENEL